MSTRRGWKDTLSAAAGVVLLASSGCSGSGQPSAHASVPASVTPKVSYAPCLPTVTEVGYTVTDDKVEYGVAARSDCPEAVINTVLTVRVLSPTGKQLTGIETDVPSLPVMLPHQQATTAGALALDKPGKVGKVTVAFTAGAVVSAKVFDVWARTVSVTGLITTPDGNLHGNVVPDPPGAGLCAPQVTVIYRGGNGKILTGSHGAVEHGGRKVLFRVYVPTAADPARTTVTITQGASYSPFQSTACTPPTRSR